MKALKKDTRLSSFALFAKFSDAVSQSLTLEGLLKEITRILSRQAQADFCDIYLVDGKESEFTKEKKLFLQIFKKKTPFILTSKSALKGLQKKPLCSKEQNFKRLIYFPLIVQNKTVGVALLAYKEEVACNKKQIETLFTILKFVSSSIKNLQSLQVSKKKDEQLGLLSEISSTIVSTKYLKEILSLIVSLTSQVLNSKICSIMLLDQKYDELFIAATQSLSEAYLKKPNIKIGQSISGKVVKTKTPLTVMDVTKEKGYMYPEVAKKEGIVSMLSVPMLVKDKVIGVINLYTDFLHKFSKDEIDTLVAVANQAAVAIENTNLTSEILNVKETLEIRKITERAKGILMKQLGISEQESYRLLQKKSMDLRKSMKEVAEAIIVAEDITK
ncbi:MAG: GAF domain-containing protein [Candidatus Omnitrophica bacterium]|nr:GAF domain-containing protein [Candidatus Omnitrophota bacterium]